MKIKIEDEDERRSYLDYCSLIPKKAINLPIGAKAIAYYCILKGVAHKKENNIISFDDLLKGSGCSKKDMINAEKILCEKQEQLDGKALISLSEIFIDGEKIKLIKITKIVEDCVDI